MDCLTHLLLRLQCVFNFDEVRRTNGAAFLLRRDRCITFGIPAPVVVIRVYLMPCPPWWYDDSSNYDTCMPCGWLLTFRICISWLGRIETRARINTASAAVVLQRFDAMVAWIPGGWRARE